MVIAGSLGQNQRPYLLPEGGRSSGRDGKYVLHPLMLVLDGSADKTHNKNQFMHQYSADPPQELEALSEPIVWLLTHLSLIHSFPLWISELQGLWLNHETLSAAVKSVLVEKL